MNYRHLFGCALSGLLLWGSLWASDARGATLSTSTPTPSLAVGDTLVVTLSVDAGAPALGCFAFSLDYDPALLRFVDAVEGSLFASATDPTFFGVGLDSLGREVVSDCVLGFGTSVPAPGNLAILRFETQTSGLAQLRYRDVILRDVNRAVIAPVTWDSLTVAVGVTAANPALPSRIYLLASPNPSRGLSRIGLWDSQGQRVKISSRSPSGRPGLTIFDVAGRRVRSLPFDPEAAVVQWDGRDGMGAKVAGGLYFAVLDLGGRTFRAKVARLD